MKMYTHPFIPVVLRISCHFASLVAPPVQSGPQRLYCLQLVVLHVLAVFLSPDCIGDVQQSGASTRRTLCSIGTRCRCFWLFYLYNSVKHVIIYSEVIQKVLICYIDLCSVFVCLVLCFMIMFRQIRMLPRRFSGMTDSTQCTDVHRIFRALRRDMLSLSLAAFASVLRAASSAELNILSYIVRD